MPLRYDQKMKRSNGESIPKRERMIVLKKDLVAADPAENALCNRHAFILPRPTQARNSGRANRVGGCASIVLARLAWREQDFGVFGGARPGWA